MTSPGTYWRTVRHLKIRQLIGRVIFRIGALPPAAGAAPQRREPTREWILPARRRPSLVGTQEFSFLNRVRSLDDGGWEPAGEDRLWRYNLHYFDDLNADGAEVRRGQHAILIERWLSENPPAVGTGWEPYPTSLRVVNWLKWIARNDGADSRWLDSVAMQLRWLQRRLEWHLLGNHLLANAKALCVGGLFFQGPEADVWRARGVNILHRQLDEQVLGDGGHFELSPMYHLLALEDVLDLLACIRCFGSPDPATALLAQQLQDCAARMWSWADLMQFDADRLPRFNDSADGIAPPLSELARVARDLGLDAPVPSADPVRLLADSGYARLRWSDALAFLDVARIGPDYIPGHAHADTLSFELCVAGQFVVVNRGTSCYGISRRRTYERGTAAHSTVQVDGRDSSEMWGGFRVGRRARPHGLVLAQDSVSCAHDGYRFLSGQPRHSRTWTMFARGLRVDDVLSFPAPAIARYHLAPGLSATRIAEDVWRVSAAGRSVAEVRFSGGPVHLSSTEQAIGFGRLETANTIEVGLAQGKATANWSW